ncbi:MAG: GNAT family N-acetyltransferase [bacterium]|nr:GNAT family N-acetyltransferase [bacterium]
MDSITCRLATNDDIDNLTKISINSFHSDYEVGAPNKTGGPPGYNSIYFYRKMLNASKAFYTILDEERIIGGFFIFQKSQTHMELTRIFIDPKYIRKGIGSRSIRYLIRKYPQIKTWTLDTPKWNIRTKSFYNKMDFRIANENNDFYYFLRQIS